VSGVWRGVRVCGEWCVAWCACVCVVSGVCGYVM